MGVRLYSVHLNPLASGTDRDAVFVREGFSWPACLFGLPWALWHRLWWPALGMFAYLMAVAAAEAFLTLDPIRVICFDTALALIIGFEANDMRRGELASKGYMDGGMASGRDLAEAELAWFAANAR
jgi:hypothetical protein